MVGWRGEGVDGDVGAGGNGAEEGGGDDADWVGVCVAADQPDG